MFFFSVFAYSIKLLYDLGYLSFATLISNVSPPVLDAIISAIISVLPFFIVPTLYCSPFLEKYATKTFLLPIVACACACAITFPPSLLLFNKNIAPTTATINTDTKIFNFISSPI